MSEATSEQLTPFESEALRQFETRERNEGRTITPSISQSFIRALRMSIPPSMETGGSPEQRRNLQAGTGIVDFIPPEYKDDPDVKLDRKYTKIEEEMLEVNRKATLKADKYEKPPGEKVNLESPAFQWNEYGWSEDEKTRLKRELGEKFGLHNDKCERAIEVLLLAGYTASEVSAKLEEDSQRPQDYSRSFEIFERLFSQPDNPVPQSSLKVVFNEEMHNDERVFTKDPANMEDLAWQLSWTGDTGGNDKWMVGGKHALLELRGEEKIVDGKKKFLGKYYVNENNVLEWFRSELDLLYDIHGPNTPIQVQDFIQLRKGGFYKISFRDIIEKKGQLFTSEDGKTSYEQTWLQLQWESNTFQTLYDNDIIYRQASGMGMEEWMKQYEQMTLMNPLTKLGFRTNMMQRLLTGTQDYEEGRVEFFQDKYLSDNVLGGAFVEMVLAFYNLGDFQKLQQVLGKNSSFFTRAGWIKAIEKVAAATAKRTGGQVSMAPEVAKAFEKAFKDGSDTVKDQLAFIEFINICTTNLPGAYQELFVKAAVQNSVTERFKLDGRAGMSLTSEEAWFFTRFMGGLARNDIGSSEKGPNPSVHDKLSELINMNSNRLKYAQGEGKPYGNLQTLGKHLAAAVLPMLGIVTEQEVQVRDEYGRAVMKKDGKSPLMKRKSVLQIFEELHALRVNQHERVTVMRDKIQLTNDPKERAAFEAQMLNEQIKQNRLYMDIVARDAVFRENAHREYTQVHLKTGYKWMERIMHGKGIDLNKYTHYDAFGGVTVKREEFIKDIQSDLIGTVRDMVKKYKWMNMNEDVRMPFFNPYTHKMEFRDAKLAQMLFGYDVLNCEAFWKRDSAGRPLKHHGFAEIDFNKVEEDRLQLMKQVFMTEVSGDLYNHQIANSGDTRFNKAYYLNFVEALKTVSGKVVVDELAKHGIKVKSNFMTDKDLEWLKERALNGRILWWDAGVFGFHLKWWITSLWDKTDKDGLGVGKMFSIIAQESFKSASA